MDRCSVVLTCPLNGYDVLVDVLYYTYTTQFICFRPRARVRLSVCLSVCVQDY